MTSQDQRDNSSGQTTARHGATLGIDGPSSPKACGMQRLVGHQMTRGEHLRLVVHTLDAVIELDWKS
jgi:hypothetical protein